VEIFPRYFRGYLRENCGKWKKCDLTAAWEQKFRENRGSSNDFCDHTAGRPVNFVFWLVRQVVGSLLGNRQQHLVSTTVSDICNYNGKSELSKLLISNSARITYEDNNNATSSAWNNYAIVVVDGKLSNHIKYAKCEAAVWPKLSTVAQCTNPMSADGAFTSVCAG